ncbi:AAA-associated domain-containing protein [Amycolatopsis sp. NPDC051128]|uniref:AAA-associated domain-containing protein n=1 Tax=Amycolatopsis sp. NPDC051128 TaxID=3155412 RepID=UPI00342B09C2
MQESKKIFAEQVRDRAPPGSALSTRHWPPAPTCSAAAFSTGDARQQLDTAIDWGRYAELFDYDTGQLALDPTHGSTSIG